MTYIINEKELRLIQNDIYIKEMLLSVIVRNSVSKSMYRAALFDAIFSKQATFGLYLDMADRMENGQGSYIGIEAAYSPTSTSIKKITYLESMFESSRITSRSRTFLKYLYLGFYQQCVVELEKPGFRICRWLPSDKQSLSLKTYEDGFNVTINHDDALDELMVYGSLDYIAFSENTASVKQSMKMPNHFDHIFRKALVNDLFRPYLSFNRRVEPIFENNIMAIKLNSEKEHYGAVLPDSYKRLLSTYKGGFSGISNALATDRESKILMVSVEVVKKTVSLVFTLDGKHMMTSKNYDRNHYFTEGDCIDSKHFMVIDVLMELLQVFDNADQDKSDTLKDLLGMTYTVKTQTDGYVSVSAV